MLVVELLRVFDPHLNLAVEEHLLRNVVGDEPVLLFYVNDPSVVVGRNQNVFEEIDLAYARAQGVPVLRRLSGGGTVYHDRGNLNYSLITPGQELLNNYAAFTAPVVDALSGFGVRAELRNRSSIFVGDSKISGNAQYASGGKLISHGTILCDVDLPALKRVLRPHELNIDSRAVQSVRSKVSNLRDLLDGQITLATLRQSLKHNFVGSGMAVDYEISETAWQQIHELANSRYRSWSWNIGRSPRFTVTKCTPTVLGEITVTLFVEDGLIQKINCHGEAAELLSWATISACLHGVRYDPDEIEEALDQCAADELIRLSEGVRPIELFY